MGIISSRELSRISAREVIARGVDFNVDQLLINPEDPTIDENIREALTTPDGGRQGELATSGERQKMIAVAQNRNLHPEVQMMLAQTTGNYEDVTKAVLAKNPVITEDVQKLLSKGRVVVRKALAENPNLTEAIQLKMASKARESEEVTGSLAKNPNLGWQAAQVLLPKLRSWDKKALLKSNTTLPFQKNLYEKLVENQDWYQLTSFLESAPLAPAMQTRVIEDMSASFQNPEQSSTMRQVWKGLTRNPSLDDPIRVAYISGIESIEDYPESRKTEDLKNIATLAKTKALVDKMMESGLSAFVASNRNIDIETMLTLLGEEQSSSIADSISETVGKIDGNAPDEIVQAILDTNKASAIMRICSNLTPENQVKVLDKLNEPGFVADSYARTRFAERLSQNLQRHPDTELYLAKYGDASARRKTAGTTSSESIQQALFEGISHTTGYSWERRSIIQALASNPELHPSIRNKMLTGADTNSDEDFNNVLQLPNLTDEEVEALFERAANPPSVGLKTLTRNVALSEELQKRLIETATSGDENGRASDAVRELARGKNLVPQLQVVIADESKPWADGYASKNMAGRNDLTPEAIAVLSQSGFESVKRALLQNDLVPDETKSKIKEILQIMRENKWGEDFRYRSDAPFQPTQEKQIELFEAGDPLMVRLLAANSTEPEILSKYIPYIGQPVIGMALAENEAVPREIAEALVALNKGDINTRLIKNKGVDASIKVKIIDAVQDADERLELLNLLMRQGYAPQDVQFKVWEATKDQQLKPGRRNKLNPQFEGLIRLKNLDPSIQLEVAKSKSAFVRQTLAENSSIDEVTQRRLALDKSSKVRKTVSAIATLAPAAQKILLQDKDRYIRDSVIKNPNLSEELQRTIAEDGGLEQRIALARNRGLLPTAISILAKDDYSDIRAYVALRAGLDDAAQRALSTDTVVDIRRALAKNITIDGETQKTLSADPDERVRINLAANEKINEAAQRTLSSDSSVEVVNQLKRNVNIVPEIKIKTQSKIPEGFNKDEFVARVHKNKYVFRILEKYMEDNSLTQLEAKNFKGTPIERYRQQPLVDAMFKGNNGKPLTIEHIQKALEKMDAKEFYIFHNDFGSGIQSHEKFRNIPRSSFALLFKDLEGDPTTLQFMKDVAPKLAHGHHGSMGGWGAMNMGWILWKDITSVVGHPAILIEQIQSDWRGLMSKIKAIRDDIDNPSSRAAAQMLEQWEEEHGAESLTQIQRNLDALVKDYPEKLMAEFLSNSGVRGKTVYITGRDTQQKLVGHSSDRESVMLDTIYERMPAAFGFKPSEELPGFLKLERANMKYRQIIKQAAQKLLKEGFDSSGIDERLQHNVDALRGTDIVGYESKQLHGVNLATRSVGKVVQQNGSKIVVQNAQGTQSFDLSQATYLRVDAHFEVIRFSMDHHE